MLITLSLLISRSGFFPIATDDRVMETMEQFEAFLQAYRQECALLLDDFDGQDRDSMEQLMIESLVGGMTSALTFLLLIAFFSTKASEGGKLADQADTFMKFLPPLFQAFDQCKRQLQQRFPDLVQRR